MAVIIIKKILTGMNLYILDHYGDPMLKHFFHREQLVGLQEHSAFQMRYYLQVAKVEQRQQRKITLQLQYLRKLIYN